MVIVVVVVMVVVMVMAMVMVMVVVWMIQPEYLVKRPDVIDLSARVFLGQRLWQLVLSLLM